MRGARRLSYADPQMRNLLLALLHLAVVTAKLCGPGGVRAVMAENLLLKQQLIVLRRARKRAPNLTSSDRLLCGFWSIFLSPGRIRKARHRSPPLDAPGVSSSLGPSQIPSSVFIDAVPQEAWTEGSERGPHPGHRRAQVAQSAVRLSADCAHHLADVRDRHRQERRVPRAGETLSPRPGGTGPSWLSFIGHTRDSLWSVDLFRCESIVLRSYWVLVVMDQFTRRLVGIGVQCGTVTGADVCRMFNAAIHGQGVPRHLSTDHDPLFEAHRWMANLRILEIDEIKTVPHVPLSHPFVERLIGTMRREFLDHVLFWNGRDLERKLAEFQAYYNAARCHASLDGHTPLTFAGGHTVAPADLNQVRWVSHCRDLVQLPVAA